MQSAGLTRGFSCIFENDIMQIRNRSYVTTSLFLAQA